MASDYDRKLELENAMKWKETRDPKYFQDVYRSMKPLIHLAGGKARIGSNIPNEVFELRAIQQFHDSLKSFKPEKGTQLQTHVFRGVQEKLKRLNYKYDKIARTPERSGGGIGAYHIGSLMDTTAILRQTLNREPTDFEIAQEMGVSAKQVENLKKDMVKDYSFSGELEDLSATDDYSEDQAVLDSIYYDLTPDQRRYYDHVTGSHGVRVVKKHTGSVDQKAIARAMGKTLKEVQTLRKGVAKMMEKAK